MPRNGIRRKRECKAQLETNVSTKRRLARMQRNRTNKPHLAHARNHTRDTAAEREDGSDTWWEFGGLVVQRRLILIHRALVEEVIGEGDALVNGEPVSCRRLAWMPRRLQQELMSRL